VRNLASKEKLLHPNPRMRLRLPDLLAAITGPSLDRFSGTTPLGCAGAAAAVSVCEKD